MGNAPRCGKREIGDALLRVVRDHVPSLRAIGFATDRPAQAMRGRFDDVCDIVPLKELAETGDMFATFVPVEL